LGSPVATTNSSKTVLQRSEYEPYGYLLNRPTEDGPGYTGHVTDAATGLVYMQQRYYDPEIGRFDSVDEVTAYQKPLTHFNRYLYALNNPYRFVDPDGRTYDVRGDPEAVAKFNRLVKQLEKTPTGAALVKSVRESKQNAVITVETKGKNITNSSDQPGSVAGKPTDAKVHINVD
jgi:RHS repeat-associated protein